MVPDRSQRIHPALSGEELLHSVGGIGRIARIQVVNFLMLPSSELTLDDIGRLASAIEALPDADGVVVVQGTDTIEETSIALSALVDRSVSLIVTGAMRGPLELGADGAANLRAAILAATDRRLRGLGACVVMNDEIHSAVYVQKANTASPSAFVSPGCGALGYVVEGKARLATLPAVKVPKVKASGPFPAVALVRVGLGDDGRLVGALRGCGYGGIVLEGMGVGHLPRPLLEHVDALLALQVPIVLARRDGGGSIFHETYGYLGSESDLLGRGVVSAGLLSGLKARVLLQLILAAGEPARIRECFEAANPK